MASFCSTFLTRKFLFSFFIFTGELQYLKGKCFNSEFVMENHIILFVNALVMRYVCKKTCDVHRNMKCAVFHLCLFKKIYKVGGIFGYFLER